MNICFLSDAAPQFLTRWSKYFAEIGHEVHVITLNPNVHEGYSSSVEVHIARKSLQSQSPVNRLQSLIPSIRNVRRLVKRINPDIIHVHSSGGYAWLTMLSGLRPYIITPWGSDILIDSQRSLTHRFLTKLALGRADLITTDAYHVKDVLIGLGVPGKKIRIVFFGTDLRQFNPGTGDAEFRNQYALGDAQVVIDTRTLTPIHDVGTFVSATSSIKRAIPNSIFVVVGDGSERESLEGLSHDIGVGDSVRFAGRVDANEMVRWLQTADVYVSTSLSDAGLADSTSEAMACGLPVVVTDNADNRHWVEEGKGGFLVSEGNPEQLADRVVRLLKDKRMRADFGRFNRQVIEERNNSVTEMSKMEAIYEEVVTRRQKTKSNR